MVWSGPALCPRVSEGFGVFCESAGCGDVTGLSGFLDVVSPVYSCLGSAEEAAFGAPFTFSPLSITL